MTSLLSEAFEKASRLPETLQDALAKELIAEIEGEVQWDETLSKSQELLDKMADKALQDYEDGKTHPLGFDEL